MASGEVTDIIKRMLDQVSKDIKGIKNIIVYPPHPGKLPPPPLVPKPYGRYDWQDRG